MRLPLVQAVLFGLFAVTAMQGTPSTVLADDAATEPTTEPAQPPPVYAADGVDQYGWTKELSDNCASLREVGVYLIVTEQAAGYVYPESLGVTFSHIAPKTPQRIQELFVLPADRKELPKKVDAAWIDANTSYVYLAANGVPEMLGDDAGDTIVFHTPLDRPFKHPRHGDVILAQYEDGHAELLKVDHAKQQIAESIKRWDAARDK